MRLSNQALGNPVGTGGQAGGDAQGQLRGGYQKGSYAEGIAVEGVDAVLALGVGGASGCACMPRAALSQGSSCPCQYVPP